MLSQKGFSLVELMIAMSIFGVVMAAVTNAFMLQRRTLSIQEQVSTMTEQAQTSLDLIAREVRSAGMDPLGTAGLTLVTANINQLELQSDRNLNGVRDPDESVTYRFVAADKRIIRNAGTDEIVADNIELFQWAYLDQAGNVTTDPTKIKQLDLTIRSRTARPDRHYSANGGYRTYTLTSRIGLHN